MSGRVNLPRILGNTFVSLAAQAVTWTSTFLLTVAYGRFLGDEAFGELYFALTFVLLVGFPIEVGFNQQLTRDVAQDPPKARRYLASTLLIKLALWAVLYGAIALLTRALGYPPPIRALVSICGVTLLFTSVANALAAAHNAFERSSISAMGTVVEKGSTAIVGIAWLGHGGTVNGMAVVLLGGALARVAWHAAWFFRYEGTSFRIYRADLESIVRVSIPFIVYGALGVIYYRVDTVMLSLMSNTTTVGWYGAAYRILDTLVFLPNLLTNIIMAPVLAKLSVDSDEDLKIALEKTLNVLLFAGIPMATGMIMTAPAMISVLYQRPEFSHSVPVLQALAPGLVCLYANFAFTAALIAVKRERRLVTMAVAALFFNVALNIAAIVWYQHVGAALVTSLTELLLLFLAIKAVPQVLRPYGSLRVLSRALLASAVMASTLWAIGSWFQVTSLLVVIPLGAFTYLVVAAALGTVPAADLSALYSALRARAFNRASRSRHLRERELEAI